MDKLAAQLTKAERAGLAMLERGGMTPDAFAAAVWPETEAALHFTAGGPTDEVAKAREGRAILLLLQRHGLATLAGSRWQVTAAGRRLALSLHPAPDAPR